MKHGPLVFLAAFFALSASWCGLVLTPQIQIGRQDQGTNSLNQTELYPQARPGLARQGLDVYRANGCAACHSQQVSQTGVACDVVLTGAGTNATRVAQALVDANVGISKATATGVAAGLPKAVLRGATIDDAKRALNALQSAGAKARIDVVPEGPDIERRWGLRRSIAQDFLFDNPVMLGSIRIGPDLANVGVRWPLANWHLMHLYNPKMMVKDSSMPSFRYLFEERRIEWRRSPDALEVPSRDGFEIVPRPEARALVAYLMSLRADVPLFEAPATPVAAQTNPPAK